MNRAATALRYWHTIRHLRRIQITGRLRHLLFPGRRVSADASAPPLRQRQAPFTLPVAPEPSMTAADSFMFLSEPGTLPDAAGWNDPRHSDLWLYNLHYFHDLTAKGAAHRKAWHRDLIARWITENPPPLGNGWEPYPLSLRIVSWIKWALAEHDLGADARNSLAAQVRHLVRSIEWHLLGNHLLANAKALMFAGAFFSGSEAKEWLRRGSSIYRAELKEQILADGGHFERSPMYHATILEDVLDLINLGQAYRGPWQHGLDSQLAETAWAMRQWLRLMSHPDGQIAFFNDAAFGIAASPAEIEAYALRLGLPALTEQGGGVAHLAASGYVRLERGGVVMIVDAAPIGPDYLPGHAHADTLSLELSLGAERLIVNGGTSMYGVSQQRQRERSTAAHSTVEIDGESSSEVWGSFRVARRARVGRIEIRQRDGCDIVSASHDGYHRLAGRNIHHRTWIMGDNVVEVHDHVSGPHHNAVARFHLGEGVGLEIDVSRRGGHLRTRRGARISWTTTCPARSEPSQWHPRFGATVSTRCLVVPLESGRLATRFRVFTPWC